MRNVGGLKYFAKSRRQLKATFVPLYNYIIRYVSKIIGGEKIKKIFAVHEKKDKQ